MRFFSTTWSSHRALFAVAIQIAGVALACDGATSQTPHDGLRFTGVNIAGAEFGGGKLPGKAGTDYFYPSSASVDYFAAKGMNTLRVPFRWERLQPVLGGDLDAEEFKRLDAVVRYATSRGLNVLLDVHNYASYRREVIGTQAVPVDALRGLWGPLAARYKSNDKVIFGLMNEPKGLRTEIWLEAANAAAAAIRTSGARNLIFVPGNGWSGAHSWLARNYGTPNGEAMLGFSDLAQNYAYEVHQYLDSNFSGTHPACRNESIGVTTLTPFTQWLRQNHKRAFLGEFGAGADPTCLAALDAMLAFLDQNRDVWLGWTYWAAGPWPNDYFTSLQPIDGADRPQMAVLLRHIARRGNGGR